VLCYNEGVLEEQVRRRRDKARWVEDRLTQFYGPRPYNPDAYDSDLLGALVATLLSQHTSDLNSGRAFASLKRAFPGGWEEVRTAPVNLIADAIRSGGLAEVKAPRIKSLIQDVHQRTGATNLDLLRDMATDAERLSYLKSFHGIGPKTAACVLCFNMGRPVIPVDTHVHRVSMRLGLIGAKTSADRAHDELLNLLPERDAYSFHVHLIEHGRTLCHARRPACPQCPVRGRCDYAIGNTADEGRPALKTGTLSR
jgi:endonuclease III